MRPGVDNSQPDGEGGGRAANDERGNEASASPNLIIPEAALNALRELLNQMNEELGRSSDEESGNGAENSSPAPSKWAKFYELLLYIFACILSAWSALVYLANNYFHNDIDHTKQQKDMHVGFSLTYNFLLGVYFTKMALEQLHQQIKKLIATLFQENKSGPRRVFEAAGLSTKMLILLALSYLASDLYSGMASGLPKSWRLPQWTFSFAFLFLNYPGIVEVFDNILIPLLAKMARTLKKMGPFWSEEDANQELKQEFKKAMDHCVAELARELSFGVETGAQQFNFSEGLNDAAAKQFFNFFSAHNPSTSWDMAGWCLVVLLSVVSTLGVAGLSHGAVPSKDSSQYVYLVTEAVASIVAYLAAAIMILSVNVSFDLANGARRLFEGIFSKVKSSKSAWATFCTVLGEIFKIAPALSCYVLFIGAAYFTAGTSLDSNDREFGHYLGSTWKLFIDLCTIGGCMLFNGLPFAELAVKVLNYFKSCFRKPTDSAMGDAERLVLILKIIESTLKNGNEARPDQDQIQKIVDGLLLTPVQQQRIIRFFMNDKLAGILPSLREMIVNNSSFQRILGGPFKGLTTRSLCSLMQHVYGNAELPGGASISRWLGAPSVGELRWNVLCSILPGMIATAAYGFINSLLLPFVSEPLYVFGPAVLIALGKFFCDFLPFLYNTFGVPGSVKALITHFLGDVLVPALGTMAISWISGNFSEAALGENSGHILGPIAGLAGGAALGICTSSLFGNRSSSRGELAVANQDGERQPLLSNN